MKSKTKASTKRSGRNLPVATLIGVVLGSLVLASLLLEPWAFVGMATVMLAVATWEIRTVFAQAGYYAPTLPLLAAAVGVPIAAYTGGPAAMLTAYFLCAIAVVVWTAMDSHRAGARNAAVGVFVTSYVPLMAGFAFLLLDVPKGTLLVITYMAIVVASDVGGYMAGVRFGRHPMAAGVSPGKSWEGFAGSVVGGMLIGGGLGQLLFLAPLYLGAMAGVLIVAAATLGDLAESMLKRDLGVKDMGSAIPGHGGVMERLDSMLLAAPVAYVALGWMLT